MNIISGKIVRLIRSFFSNLNLNVENRSLMISIINNILLTGTIGHQIDYFIGEQEFYRCPQQE